MAAYKTSETTHQVHMLGDKLQRVLEERERILDSQRLIFGNGRRLVQESVILVEDCRTAREARRRRSPA